MHRKPSQTQRHTQRTKTRSHSASQVGIRKIAADDKEQSKRFIEKAREIGANEVKSAANELMGRLAKIPRQPHTKKEKRRPTL